MTETPEQKRDRLAEEHLSQFCIAPGTPHWMAGERDFVAGYSSRDEEVARLRAEIKELREIGAVDCPWCGSCGEIGCCEPKKCLYPEVKSERLSDLEAEIAAITRQLGHCMEFLTWLKNHDHYLVQIRLTELLEALSTEPGTPKEET